METYLAYIGKVSPNGWLTVRFDSGLEWPLPEYLRVYVESETEEREYFEVLEGRWRGRKASVRKKGWRSNDWDGSYFEANDETTWYGMQKGIPHKGPAEMTFYKKLEKVEIKGLGTFNAFTYYHPLPPGTYDLEIPYEPHKSSSAYSVATYYKTWFRIGHSGDWFFHCGQRSNGCITVKDIHEWDTIYKYMILCRKDNENVGTVKIIDQ